MRITFVTIRPVLLLHFIFAFTVPVNAQTIPKSIDKAATATEKLAAKTTPSEKKQKAYHMPRQSLMKKLRG